MSTIAEVYVVIPARDEEALLGRCLTSVAGAVDELILRHPSSRVSTLVVLDRCVDGSAGVAAAFDVPVLKVALGRAGAARRAGVDHVTRACRNPRKRVWIANTDADTVVPRHWLTKQVALAERGCDLVLGTVEPDPDDLGSGVADAWRTTYTSAEQHPHVHAANLGLTLSAYRATGGWADVASDEDVMLVRAARAAGLWCVSTDEIRVRTSGRLRGRAPAGFAAFLALLDESDTR